MPTDLTQQLAVVRAALEYANEMTGVIEEIGAVLKCRVSDADKFDAALSALADVEDRLSAAEARAAEAEAERDRLAALRVPPTVAKMLEVKERTWAEAVEAAAECAAGFAVYSKMSDASGVDVDPDGPEYDELGRHNRQVEDIAAAIRALAPSEGGR